MVTDGQVGFVNSQRVAHLATASASGDPHVVPVCFAYLHDEFWVVIDEKPKRTTRLKRLRNIGENPRVSLIFDRYEDDWSRLGWVQVSGSAEVVTSAPPDVIAALQERYPQYREMQLEGREAIRITPNRITGWGSLDDE
jgi:PPOX class probable F420-dependent enzyme